MDCDVPRILSDRERLLRKTLLLIGQVTMLPPEKLVILLASECVNHPPGFEPAFLFATGFSRW